MKTTAFKHPVDFEQFGYETMLATQNEERAKHICALHLHAFEDGLQPELGHLGSSIAAAKQRMRSLCSHLYDRPIPVRDAAMLARSVVAGVLVFLAALAAVACLAGNTTTFYLFGFGGLVSVLLGAGATALPLVVGHLAYDRFLVHNRTAQAIVAMLALGLCFAGAVQLAEARRGMMGHTSEAPAASSYVDDPSADPSAASEPKGQSTDDSPSEQHVRSMLGQGMLLFMLGADLVLGFLVGLYTTLRTDDDYAAWRHLKQLGREIMDMEKRQAEIQALIESARKRCMAGILRAASIFTKRSVPYHLLGVFVLVAFLSWSAQAQAPERQEAILIDASGSIGNGSGNADLFREYLRATRKLLLTEPPRSRVWVSVISTDSFGGVRDVLKGWTPEVRGVFTDDLTAARKQMASAFEAKSSGMAAAAQGTDIIGALWHVKATFESGPAGRNSERTIWIFSDMMNETSQFNMPALIALGPEQMLQQAKAKNLIVPLQGYAVAIYGATPAGLSPQAWNTVKSFWVLYFETAGAKISAYSVDCDVQR